MDQTHIHLLITHLPIFGAISGIFVLIYAFWKKSDQTKIAAYLLFMISSAGAAVSYLTGEASEETVENITGVSKTMIGQHEDAAVVALVCMIVLGAVSVIGAFITSRKPVYARVIAIFILLVSLISFGFAARTGYLGGQIRHTEVTPSATAPIQGGENEEQD
jgi:uncharacterized membrane protein